MVSRLIDEHCSLASQPDSSLYSEVRNQNLPSGTSESDPIHFEVKPYGRQVGYFC